MSKIKITINNREVEAYEGQTVLEAAKNNGIHIPTLCYLKDVTGTGACRVCQVEVEGAKTLGIKHDDNISVYCRSGRRASMAQEALEKAGYKNVKNLGGLKDAQAVLGK